MRCLLGYECATRYLERIAEPVRERGLRVHTQVMFGPPALAIIDAATNIGASAIAMSTHGHEGAARMLLGSVADKVVR